MIDLSRMPKKSVNRYIDDHERLSGRDQGNDKDYIQLEEQCTESGEGITASALAGDYWAIAVSLFEGGKVVRELLVCAIESLMDSQGETSL